MDKVGICMNKPFLKNEKKALFVKGVMDKKRFVKRRKRSVWRRGG